MSMSLDTWAPLVYQCLTNVVAHGYNRVTITPRMTLDSAVMTTRAEMYH
jgi:hypothetical protein